MRSPIYNLPRHQLNAHSPIDPPPLGADLRRRISCAIDLLIDLLDQDDAMDPAHECEGQELWAGTRGWIGVDPDLESALADQVS